MNSIRAEKLVNGYIRMFCYKSGLSGLYNSDGTYYAGDLRLSFFDAIKIISSM